MTYKVATTPIVVATITAVSDIVASSSVLFSLEPVVTLQVYTISVMTCITFIIICRVYCAKTTSKLD